MVGKARVAEHDGVREPHADGSTTRVLSNVKTPADPVADMVPDVQADYFAKIVYGEAKLCGDFPSQDTKEQLLNYCGGLPSEYKLVLGIPKGCEPAVQRVVAEWGFTHRIQLVGL